jgi:uncharacterized FlaG/YvyC family protein
LESASQEKLIQELRLKLGEAEKEAPKVNDDESAQLIERLRSELQEQQEALAESQRLESGVQKMIEELKEQVKEVSKDLEEQLAEVYAVYYISHHRGMQQRKL